MTETAFNPDWCIAPAATLREWIEENGVSPHLMAACSGRAHQDATQALVEEVLARKPLTEAHAAALAQETYVPARVWLALEHNYRAGLAAGLKDVTED